MSGWTLVDKDEYACWSDNDFALRYVLGTLSYIIRLWPVLCSYDTVIVDDSL